MDLPATHHLRIQRLNTYKLPRRSNPLPRETNQHFGQTVRQWFPSFFQLEALTRYALYLVLYRIFFLRFFNLCLFIFFRFRFLPQGMASGFCHFSRFFGCIEYNVCRWSKRFGISCSTGAQQQVNNLLKSLMSEIGWRREAPLIRRMPYECN